MVPTSGSSGATVLPLTYIGWNKDRRIVASCTAENANMYIDPEAVKAAIDNVKTVAEEHMNKIKSKLSDVALTSDKALIVEGTKMTKTIEEIRDSLGTLPGMFYDAISSFYPESVKARNNLQDQLNEEARSAINSYRGVDYITVKAVR